MPAILLAAQLSDCLQGQGVQLYIEMLSGLVCQQLMGPSFPIGDALTKRSVCLATGVLVKRQNNVTYFQSHPALPASHSKPVVHRALRFELFGLLAPLLQLLMSSCPMIVPILLWSWRILHCILCQCMIQTAMQVKDPGQRGYFLGIQSSPIQLTSVLYHHLVPLLDCCPGLGRMAFL